MSVDLHDGGSGDEEVLIAEGEWQALGSDPFEEVVETDPFVEGLALLGLQPDAAPAAEPARPLRPAPAGATPLRSGTADATPDGDADVQRGPVPAVRPGVRPAAPTPLVRRRGSATPSLSEVDVPDPEGWFDRLIPSEDRRRLAALSHLVESEAAYDRFGLAPDVLKRAFPFIQALYRAWFRVRSDGAERIPREGPAILAANHGGLLPFDGAMLVMDVALHTDPPRLPRAVVDRWAGSLPWVNVFYARVGQIVGTRENFADLLDDGQLLLVFPEGMEGVRKPVNQRYRLQRFHVGFVEQALRAGAPVVPVAVIGSDDQAPILYDFRGLAKRLGLPALPITPTFPWLGPLGLLPYPVPYHIVYGEPMRFHERFGPEDADDARLVQYLAKQVRTEVQHLVDRNR